MYDDTFNPLGIQGGGVRPPHERTFFVNSKPLQWTKFLNIFKSELHTSLFFAHAPMTHFEL